MGDSVDYASERGGRRHHPEFAARGSFGTSPLSEAERPLTDDRLTDDRAEAQPAVTPGGEDIILTFPPDVRLEPADLPKRKGSRATKAVSPRR